MPFERHSVHSCILIFFYFHGMHARTRRVPAPSPPTNGFKHTHTRAHSHTSHTHTHTHRPRPVSPGFATVSNPCVNVGFSFNSTSAAPGTTTQFVGTGSFAACKTLLLALMGVDAPCWIANGGSSSNLNSNGGDGASNGGDGAVASTAAASDSSSALSAIASASASAVSASCSFASAYQPTLNNTGAFLAMSAFPSVLTTAGLPLATPGSGSGAEYNLSIADIGDYAKNKICR